MHANTDRHLHRAIDLLYEAVLDPDLWPLALREITAFVGTSGALMLYTDPASREVRHAVNVGLPEPLVAGYKAGMSRRCPRLANAFSRPEGVILHDYQHIGEQDIDGDEYYAWLRRTGKGSRYYLGCRLPGPDGLHAFNALTFRHREGPPQASHMERIAAILPHLRRALELGDRLERRDILAQASLGLLDQLRRPVALLDDRGRAISTNAAFDKTGNACGCVRVHDGSAVIANPARQRELEQLLERAAAGGGAQPHGNAAKTFAVSHEGRNCSITVVALPVDGSREQAQRACVALVLSDHMQTQDSVMRDLQARFGFTRAQARLAAVLIAGESLAGASRKLNVTVNTARSHLQAIFARTGTRRQADLVRVLLSPPFQQPDPHPGTEG
jgi:DNA-binding CsgD family transcriptional regulator